MPDPAAVRQERLDRLVALVTTRQDGEVPISALQLEKAAVGMWGLRRATAREYVATLIAAGRLVERFVDGRTWVEVAARVEVEP